ncbi:hypothetical protein HK104_000918 [Borealophlyctis nickersoniae]|nr:hypothetical protein HK104_000918 [Borealophlyctis nickersoniae]
MTSQPTQRMTTRFRQLLKEKHMSQTKSDSTFCTWQDQERAVHTLIGQPDLSVITQTEMAALARTVVAASNVPVIAGKRKAAFPIKLKSNPTNTNIVIIIIPPDTDTGFGGPLNIRRTVQLFEHAGVAGIHIEDQTFPKRCGQLEGKQVVALDEYLERIAACIQSRSDPDFYIIARTDARQSPNGSIEECIRRLNAALDVGADMGFVESPMTKEECEKVVREVKGPVLPHGLTPNLTVEECRKIGFKAAIYPCTGYIPAMLGMERGYRALKEKGTDLEPCEGKQIYDFFRMVGLDECFGFDKKMVQIVKEELNPKHKKHGGN